MTGLPPNRDVNANDIDFEGYTPTPDEPAEQRRLLPDGLARLSADDGHSGREGAGVRARRRRSAGRSCSSTNAREDVLHAAQARRDRPARLTSVLRARPITPFTIVGVVRDVKQGGMSKKTGTELYFLNEQVAADHRLCAGQHERRRALDGARRDRSRRRFSRRSARRIATLPVVKLRTMEQVFADSAARPRFLAELLGIFAGARAGARRDRHLRHPVVFGHRADEGDRHPHGARRDARERARDDPRSGDAADDRRPGRGPGRRRSALTRLLQAQLFNVKPTDPATLTAVTSFIAVRRVRRLLCAGAARDARRSDRHAPR